MNLLWYILIIITIVSILLSLVLKGKKVKETTKEILGIGKKKVAKVLYEFRRKTFHLIGLLIPGLYYFFLKYNYLTKNQCLTILGGFLVFSLTTECLRFYSESFRKFFKDHAGGIMREKENTEMHGSTWFIIGAFITMYFFDPVISIASLLFLNLGDLAAALVGRAYGNTKIVGNKSLEGTLACLATCIVAGGACFYGIPLFEYITLMGAIAATFAELIPLKLNDNLTIPIVSALVMTWARNRMGLSEIKIHSIGFGSDF